MIYIRTDGDNRIIFQNNQPFDPVLGMGETKENLEKTGHFIDSMPQPTIITGKRAIPYYNPETKKIWYNYVNSPISSHERLDEMEAAFNEFLMMRFMTQE